MGPRKNPDDKPPPNDLPPNVPGALEGYDREFHELLIEYSDAIRRLHDLWNSPNEEWSAEDQRWGARFTDWLHRLDDQHPETGKRYLSLFLTRPLPPLAICAFVHFLVEMMAPSFIGVITKPWTEIPPTPFGEMVEIACKYFPEGVARAKDWIMEMVRRHRPVIEEWAGADGADEYEDRMAKYIEKAADYAYRHVVRHPPPPQPKVIEARPSASAETATASGKPAQDQGEAAGEEREPTKADVLWLLDDTPAGAPPGKLISRKWAAQIFGGVGRKTIFNWGRKDELTIIPDEEPEKGGKGGVTLKSFRAKWARLSPSEQERLLRRLEKLKGAR